MIELSPVDEAAAWVVQVRFENLRDAKKAYDLIEASLPPGLMNRGFLSLAPDDEDDAGKPKMGDELSPVDEADVQRIVDAIIARSRADIRRQALQEAARVALKVSEEKLKHRESLSDYLEGHHDASHAVLALIDAPPAAAPDPAIVRWNVFDALTALQSEITDDSQ